LPLLVAIFGFAATYALPLAIYFLFLMLLSFYASLRLSLIAFMMLSFLFFDYRFFLRYDISLFHLMLAFCFHFQAADFDTPFSSSFRRFHFSFSLSD